LTPTARHAHDARLSDMPARSTARAPRTEVPMTIATLPLAADAAI
jgi:hypothetical protein